ncbi:MAG: hypothetical protein C5B49_10820 [Bdellovibrio sp.]|nr:MAG: hypothetical protein C5B49_10820 [Bdellovibrio sp.]
MAFGFAVLLSGDLFNTAAGAPTLEALPVNFESPGNLPALPPGPPDKDSPTAVARAARLLTRACQDSVHTKGGFLGPDFALPTQDAEVVCRCLVGKLNRRGIVKEYTAIQAFYEGSALPENNPNITKGTTELLINARKLESNCRRYREHHLRK